MEGLPSGWERIESPEFGVYYINHITRQAQYEHPCATQYLGSPTIAAHYQLLPRPHLQQLRLLQQQQQQQRGLVLHHSDFHAPNVLVPPNPYFHEEIPIWLRVYFKASPSLDALLKWDLFGLQDMESFQGMLDRLFRDELEDLVMRYEALRTAMAQEINQRQGVVQQPRQMLPLYPTATLTELPAESADPAAAATAAVEE